MVLTGKVKNTLQDVYPLGDYHIPPSEKGRSSSNRYLFGSGDM